MPIDSKTAVYRVTRSFTMGGNENLFIEKGSIVYSMGFDNLYIDSGDLSHLLDHRSRAAIKMGWLEAIPAVPYEKPFIRTRFERIVDDGFDVCPSSSADRIQVS
jgi:hypothetical protein